MPKPQKEEGYTPIANEILEALAQMKLTSHEWRFLMALFRKTYGYRKKEDMIPISQFEKLMRCPARRIWEAKRNLKDKNIIKVEDGKIEFQKDYSLWKTCG